MIDISQSSTWTAECVLHKHWNILNLNSCSSLSVFRQKRIVCSSVVKGEAGSCRYWASLLSLMGKFKLGRERTRWQTVTSGAQTQTRAPEQTKVLQRNFHVDQFQKADNGSPDLTELIPQTSAHFVPENTKCCILIQEVDVFMCVSAAGWWSLKRKHSDMVNDCWAAQF